MYRIALNKRHYSKKSAKISNAHHISEYSVTVDKEVINDKMNARYLIKDKLNGSVNFDLKKGIDTYIDKIVDIEDEYSLHPLCKWACAQEGDNLKEIFDGAQFVCRRGTMRLLASSIMQHNPKLAQPEKSWTIVAVKTGDVILLCEKNKKHGGVDAMANYSGFKFEQYMTSTKPGGEADTESPVDNRPSFMRMVRSDIVEADGQSIGICCAAEVNAIDGESSVEIQTRQQHSPIGFFIALKMVLQSEFADVKTAVIGWKTENYIVERVDQMEMTSFKRLLKKADEESLAFLAVVLRNLKSIMVTKDACEIVYVPEGGILKINILSKKEGLDLLTPEFKQKFHLEIPPFLNLVLSIM